MMISGKMMNTDSFEENGFEVHFKPERIVDGTLITKSMVICFKKTNKHKYEDYVKLFIKDYEISKVDEEEFGENTLSLVPKDEQKHPSEYVVFNIDQNLEKSNFCEFKIWSKTLSLLVRLKTEKANALIKKIREFWAKN